MRTCQSAGKGAYFKSPAVDDREATRRLRKQERVVGWSVSLGTNPPVPVPRCNPVTARNPIFFVLAGNHAPRSCCPVPLTARIGAHVQVPPHARTLSLLSLMAQSPKLCPVSRANIFICGAVNSRIWAAHPAAMRKATNQSSRAEATSGAVLRPNRKRRETTCIGREGCRASQRKQRPRTIHHTTTTPAMWATSNSVLNSLPSCLARYIPQPPPDARARQR